MLLFPLLFPRPIFDIHNHILTGSFTLKLLCLCYSNISFISLTKITQHVNNTTPNRLFSNFNLDEYCLLIDGIKHKTKAEDFE